MLETLPEIGAGLGEKAIEESGKQAAALISNPLVLGVGIAFVIIAILIIVFMKKIILNSILGVAAWVILTVIFKIELPFLPSIAVSLVFGLAGIGVMLILKFAGIV